MFSSKNSKKVWLCLIGNFVAMSLVLSVVCIFRPYPDLIVISIKIDTWNKWIILNIFIALIKGCDVLVNELGSPILGFRVYNPDKKNIDDFNKNELNFLANSMWFTNSFRNILMAVITVTQIDIAFSGMFISEIVSIFTVRHLLNGKTFNKEEQEEQEYKEDDVELLPY